MSKSETDPNIGVRSWLQVFMLTGEVLAAILVAVADQPFKMTVKMFKFPHTFFC